MFNDQEDINTDVAYFPLLGQSEENIPQRNRKYVTEYLFIVTAELPKKL